MSAVSNTKLDETCSSAHIAKISEHIVKWKELAPSFGLTPAEEEEIQMSDCNYKIQKRNMLWKWVRKQGDKATYRELKRVFEEANEALLTCKVDEFLDDTRAPDSIVDTFRQHLKDCYSSTPVTHHGQKGWPPLSESPFVSPQLVSKQTKNREVFIRNVQIADLFEEKKVMLEGTAGSGKTTLMRHICQQWANGDLLCDVDLLIHLSLDDPTLWSAKSLEDLIPYPSADHEICKTIADHIVKQQRNRVLFILDGWEDLPLDLPDALFICKVLESSQLMALPHCSFIVTTRPIASVSLQPLVTKTLEITGFSAQSVDVYATKYLTQNDRDPADFITKLNDNHYARGLCSLPINAFILLYMYLFLAIHTGFPTSQTELFKCFILNLLLRHLVAKLSHRQPRLHEFSDLPLKEKQAFDKLCIIAHHATFISSTIASRSNRLLSYDDLSKAGVDGLQETLGLMKVHHQLTWCGYDPHYGFLHSSVQDFLCAVRMSQLSAEDQVRDFIRIMTSNPTSPVLHFYAGITKLKNEKVCRYLCQIGRKAPGKDVLLELERTRSVGCDQRRLFLSYLHCLYEANKNILVSLQKHSIVVNFWYYRLSVHDLNVIFYYILDLAIRCSTDDDIVFHFGSCSIGDHAIQSAVTTLGKQAERLNQPASFGLVLADVFYTHEGVRTITKLITMENVILKYLSLRYLAPSSNVSIVLRTLTEVLSSPNSSKLTTLGLSDCNLTAGLPVYYLILLMTQARYLLQLDIGANIGLQHHISLLVIAARNLIELRINDLLADKHLLAVGQILQSSNTRLEVLNICSSRQKPMYSFESVVKFIEIITAPESRSNLKILVVDFDEELKRSENVKRALRNSALRHCGFRLRILQSYEHQINIQNFVVSQSLPKSLVSGRT